MRENALPIFNAKTPLSDIDMTNFLVRAGMPQTQFSFVFYTTGDRPYPAVRPSVAPHYYIVNLDKGSDTDPERNGTHWTVLWWNGKRCFYMDSMGLPADQPTEYFAKHVLTKGKDILRLSSAIQHRRTSTCGWFVMHAMLCAGVTPQTYWAWEQSFDPGNDVGNEAKLRKWASTYTRVTL